ncbi:MAG: hypothetical protein UZ09_BCD002002243 [Bacteroidetes bacterium OLB9]|nr:MAG: hypothetical protein UZ09_BCD002002243 [Bacteroidetes bacterium OLB9]
MDILEILFQEAEDKQVRCSITNTGYASPFWLVVNK